MHPQIHRDVNKFMHLGTFVWGADTGEAWQFLVLCGGTPPTPCKFTLKSLFMKANLCFLSWKRDAVCAFARMCLCACLLPWVLMIMTNTNKNQWWHTVFWWYPFTLVNMSHQMSLNTRQTQNLELSPTKLPY